MGLYGVSGALWGCYGASMGSLGLYGAAMGPVGLYGAAMGPARLYGVHWPHIHPTAPPFPPPPALFAPMGTFNIHPTPHRIFEVAGTPSFGYGVLTLPGGR